LIVCRLNSKFLSVIKKLNSKNINIVLAGLASVGIATHVVENIVDDNVYWIWSDIFSSVVFGILGYRLFVTRKK